MATTNFTNAVTLTDAEWFDDTDTLVYGSLSSVSGTNTITASGPSSLTAYSSGQLFRFVPAATNTGATTINISSLGAKNIFCGGAACVGDELRSGIPYLIQYDGTQFNIIGPYVGGNLPGGQIKFPSTQVASTNANTLDDYEEGTFTPAFAFGGGTTGITYTTQTGAYRKVGQIVHVSILITMSSKGSSTGAATITGLPFTASNFTMLALRIGGLAAAIDAYPSAIVNGGATTISLQKLGNASTSYANMTDADFSNTGEIVLGGTYVGSA